MEQLRGNILSVPQSSFQSKPTSSVSAIFAEKSAHSGNSSCPQSVSPHLPPTPPSSRSPPNSRLVPMPQQNAQQPHRTLTFSIDNILRPDFGKNEPSVTRPQSSRSPESPELILRTPPKTPDVPQRHDSPVDLSSVHKPQNPLASLGLPDFSRTNERLLSHSVSLLINPHNPPLHPLQHHLQQQLLQHHASHHLQHPIISKPIPLSNSTAFHLFKPLQNFAEAHQKRLQQQHLQIHQSSQNQQQQQQQPPINALKKHEEALKEKSKETSNSNLNFSASSLPSPTPSTCSTSSSCSSTSSSSPSKSSANSSSSNNCTSNKKSSSGDNLEELVNPKVPEDNSNWPAWVYCTRYSDRPSSGKSHILFQLSLCCDISSCITAFILTVNPLKCTYILEQTNCRYEINSFWNYSKLK